MSDFSSTPKHEKNVAPYNPKHLRDAQEILDKQRQRAFDDREREFYETATAEQRKERDEYEAAIQKKKDTLEIGEKDADVKWTDPDTPKRWAKVFGVVPATFKRWVKSEKIRAKKLSDRRYQVDIRDLPKDD